MIPNVQLSCICCHCVSVEIIAWPGVTQSAWEIRDAALPSGCPTGWLRLSSVRADFEVLPWPCWGWPKSHFFPSLPCPDCHGRVMWPIPRRLLSYRGSCGTAGKSNSAEGVKSVIIKCECVPLLSKLAAWFEAREKLLRGGTPSISKIPVTGRP